MNHKEEIKNIISNNKSSYKQEIKRTYPATYDQITSLNFNTFGEQLYNWLNPNSYPKCGNPKCSNIPNFKQFSHGYYEFCSASCRAIIKKSYKNGLTSESVKKRAKWRLGLSEKDKMDMYKKRLDTINGTYSSIEEYKQIRLEKSRQTQNSRYGVDNHTRKHFSSETLEILNDKHKLYDLHVTQKQSIQTIAQHLHVDWGVVKRSISKFDIPQQYSFSQSLQEKLISEFLISNNIEFLTNDRQTIFPYELDFYIPQHNISIEVCGIYWHSICDRMQGEYHKNKLQMCLDRGIRLITIFEDEINNKWDIVISRLSHLLKLSAVNVVYARKTTIQEVSPRDAATFFNSYHIQGHRPSKKYYGLYYNNELIQCMSFSASRYNKSYEWEIIRSATKSRISVPGGLSKLITHFKKAHSPKSIITFADRRWGEGHSYEKAGFVYDTHTAPSYWYVKNGKRYHRSTFMKSKIISTMNGDPSLTEVENMTNMGYTRIFDCGTNRYTWKT